MKQQKMLNTNKGITLIALVITIIVMLILVAVTISMAVNGGLFSYAGKSKISNDKNKVLEIAEMARINCMIEHLGNISEETALTAIFSELSKQGFEIKTSSTVGQQLEGLLIQDTTGTDITELNIQQGNETTIKVNLNLKQGIEKHYVFISGNYYEISIVNDRVQLSEEGYEALEGNTYTIKLTPPSQGVTLKVGSSEITEETTIVDGTEIIVIAGQTIEDFNFNVKVENTAYTKNISLNVVKNPLYATDLTLSTVNNVTRVKAGDELQLTAIIIPETATDTIEWRVISGSASIDNTGLLKVSNNATTNSNIVVGAKCVRGDGTTSTITEKTITIIVEETKEITGIESLTYYNEVRVGEKLQLIAYINYMQAADGEIIWSSSDTTKATVDQTTGLVTGVAYNDYDNEVIVTATLANDATIFKQYVINVLPDICEACVDIYDTNNLWFCKPEGKYANYVVDYINYIYCEVCDKEWDMGDTEVSELFKDLSYSTTSYPCPTCKNYMDVTHYTMGHTVCYGCGNAICTGSGIEGAGDTHPIHEVCQECGRQF